MNTTIKLGFALFVVGATASACAEAVPPAELVNARAAYTRASTGQAAQLDPADLHTAKEGLDAAERQFKDEGASEGTVNTAYIALRRTELAESRSRVTAAEKQKEAVIAAANANQANQLQVTSAQLGATKQALATQGVALQSEQQRRMDAEKRAAQAAADLAKFASVKQDATRGMIITLSGAVLFVTAKSDLLPAAQVKLNEVADVLTKQDPDSTMLVEGYTDSQGAAAMNQELSQKRAESVRTYLISRGISGDRITATGLGPSRPIADNASPEGRANNRRVEIVVTPKK